MASHDSWIDAGELAALAGELTPPETGKSETGVDEHTASAQSPEPFAPFVTEENAEEPPAATEEITAPVASDASVSAEENTDASPQVLALWDRKLADIKKRAVTNGLLVRTAPASAASKSTPGLTPPFFPPAGSTSHKLSALSDWLRITAPECEFFACDDWGNELLSGGDASPDLAAAALMLSLAAIQAAEKNGDEAPAFLSTDLGDGLLTIFPSIAADGRRFLAGVSEQPFALEAARLISAAFRSVV